MPRKNIFRRRLSKKRKATARRKKMTLDEMFGEFYSDAERICDPTIVTLLIIGIAIFSSMFISFVEEISLLMKFFFVIYMLWIAVPISIIIPYFYTKLLFPKKKLPEVYEKHLATCAIMIILWFLFSYYILPRIV